MEVGDERVGAAGEADGPNVVGLVGCGSGFAEGGTREGDGAVESGNHGCGYKLKLSLAVWFEEGWRGPGLLRGWGTFLKFSE